MTVITACVHVGYCIIDFWTGVIGRGFIGWRLLA